MHNIAECVDHLLAIFEPDRLPLHGGGLQGGCDLESTHRDLLRVISGIRVIQNASRSVLRLPVEITCIIFQYLRDSGYRDMGFPQYHHQAQTEDWILITKRRYNAWSTVTRVCRCWRKIALSHSSLWSDIFVAGVTSYDYDARQEYLSRSGSVPISLHIDTTLGLRSSILKQLRPHLSHTRALFFCVHRNPERITDFLLDAPAPHLRSVILAYSKKAYEDQGPSHQLPSFFQGSAHNITSLAYSRFVTFPGNHFSKLTQLHLMNIKFRFTTDFEALLRALECTPVLEDLVFTDVTFLAVQMAAPPNSRPRLPRLRTLSLHNVQDGHRRMKQLLLCLQPQVGTMALTLTTDTGQEHEAYEIAELLQTMPPTLRPLCDVNRATIMVNMESCSITLAGVSIAWHIGRFTFLPLELPQVLLSVFEPLQELWLSWDIEEGLLEVGYPQASSFIATILQLANLKKFVIVVKHERQTYSFEDFLCTLHLAAAHCPDLTTVHVHGVHEHLWKSLSQFASAKNVAGHPLQNLRFCIYDRAQERSMSVFRDWKRSYHAAFPSVAKVEFMELRARYPKMSLPVVCAHDTRKPWQIFNWDEEGDVQLETNAM